ncbi:MAG: zinc ribbon domain-containing protein [Acidobacteriota bacterium]
MLPDLEYLVHLQSLDNASDVARRELEELPDRHGQLDARLQEAEERVAQAKQRLADAQTARRELERDLAAVQGRLSKYKDQLMLVKTNKEYQAMQHEIATAEHEVRSREDRILEQMEVAEIETKVVKDAEKVFRETELSVAAERKALDTRRATLEDTISRVSTEREELRPKVTAEALRLFDHLAQHRGVAVAEARDGHCTICHVRMRPQVFNEIRRNDRVVQCDSCLRILYYVAPVAGEATGS